MLKMCLDLIWVKYCFTCCCTATDHWLWSPKEKNGLFTRKPLCIANFSIWENPRITVVSLTGEMWI